MKKDFLSAVIFFAILAFIALVSVAIQELFRP